MRTFNSPVRKKIIAFFFIFLTLISSNSCNYFLIRSPQTLDENTTFKNHVNNRYLVHANGEVFELYNLSFDKDALTGQLNVTSKEPRYSDGRTNRYKSTEREILNEVHFYVSDQTLTSGTVVIPLKNIHQVKVIDPNTGLTILTYVVTIALIAISLYVVILIIVLLTKSSCPYIYSNNGNEFVFEGEIFGGAIGKNLERDDYLPLQNVINNAGEYRIRINNELQERQYTDVTELMLINHPVGTRMLTNRQGTPYMICKEVAPVSAVSIDGTSQLPLLSKRDSSTFLFDNQNHTAADATNSLVLSFNRKDATRGNLILCAKNTLWFDYIYGEFIEKFGSSFDTWMEKQSNVSAAERASQAWSINTKPNLSTL